MQQNEIHDYLTRYFQTNGCEMIEEEDSYFTVQLTVEMDKELMNRPFYWHYLEKTGGIPNPMKLTMITDQQKAPKDKKGEVIHFGSPRLHQIFRSTRSLASAIRLYQDIQETNGSTPLQPWLCLNAKISYQSNRKKERLLSLGLNLINGRIIENFHDQLLQMPLTPKIPDFCFTLTPLIKPKSGINRLQGMMKQIIEQDDHTWAQKARDQLQEDLKLLHHFYDEKEEMPESFEVEKRAIYEQYEPKIVVSILNGGLFYLK